MEAIRILTHPAGEISSRTVPGALNLEKHNTAKASLFGGNIRGNVCDDDVAGFDQLIPSRYLDHLAGSWSSREFRATAGGNCLSAATRG